MLFHFRQDAIQVVGLRRLQCENALYDKSSFSHSSWPIGSKFQSYIPPCSPIMASFFGESTVVTCIRAGLYQTKKGFSVLSLLTVIMPGRSREDRYLLRRVRSKGATTPARALHTARKETPSCLVYDARGQHEPKRTHDGN
jgi:hypothetical protein